MARESPIEHNTTSDERLASCQRKSGGGGGRSVARRSGTVSGEMKAGKVGGRGGWSGFPQKHEWDVKGGAQESKGQLLRNQKEGWGRKGNRSVQKTIVRYPSVRVGACTPWGGKK